MAIFGAIILGLSGQGEGRATRPSVRRPATRRRSFGGLPVRVRGGIRGLRPFASLPAAHEGTAVARQRGPGRRRGDRRLNLPTDVETCNREVTAGPNLDPRARAAIASRSRARTLSIVVVRQSARALRGPWGDTPARCRRAYPLRVLEALNVQVGTSSPEPPHAVCSRSDATRFHAAQ